MKQSIFHLPRLTPSASQTFAAFRHSNYRLWAVGMFISSMGGWMQSTAQGYLIYELTQSTAYLGYISFAAGIPVWLLTLYGGVLSDRVPRRLLLMITQMAMMVTALALGVLIFIDQIQPWHVLVASFCLGIINAFDAPTRQVFVVELVGKEDLTNAIALNSAIFHTATVLGPAVGGIIYALAGPGWCFTLNGLSFMAIIASLFLIRVISQPRAVRSGSTASQLRAGLSYSLHNEPIRTLLIDLAVIMLFGFSFVTLIPAWSVDILGGDVQTNGLLLSARGLGALSGGLMIAFLGSRRMRGRLLAIASFVLPALLLIFSLVRWLPASVAALAGIGWSLMVCVNLTNALIQTTVPDEMRGRVMGLYVLILFGASPLGSLLIGSSAAKFSAPTAILINAVLLALFVTYTWFRKPFMRKLE